MSPPLSTHLDDDVLACQLYKPDIVRDVYAKGQAPAAMAGLETTDFG
jgi:hypothetical protein